MEILVINENKLKIMLQKEDMKKYGLLGSDLNYDDPPTRKKLLSILDKAKAESGFDASADKLLVQLYPSKDGGSEMFVTRLGVLSASAEQSLKRSRGVGVFMRGTEIYFSPLFSSILQIARILKGISFIERSHLYYEESHGYYFIFEERCGGGALSPLLPVLEFADPIDASMQPYIEEYANLLIEKNAISKLCDENLCL